MALPVPDDTFVSITNGIHNVVEAKALSIEDMSQVSITDGIIWITAVSGATSAIKTINGLANASVKTIIGLARASVKTWQGLP